MGQNKSIQEEKNKFNFDITKADKIFDYLLENGQIKLTRRKGIANTIILILITLMIAKFLEMSSSKLSTKERFG